MRSLKNDGFIIEGKKYYASIAQTAADNLGSRQLHGLKACFRGKHICNLCNATTDAIQKFLVEYKFVLNTINSYNEKIESFRNTPDSVAHHGIINTCSLNTLTFI